MATKSKSSTPREIGRSGSRTRPARDVEDSAGKATRRRATQADKTIPSRSVTARKVTKAKKVASAEKVSARKVSSATKSAATKMPASRKGTIAKKVSGGGGGTVAKTKAVGTPGKRAIQKKQGGEGIIYYAHSAWSGAFYLADTSTRVAASRAKIPLMSQLTKSQDRKSQALAEAQFLGLAEKLLGQRKIRLIAQALQDRASQEELAASLGTSQASISRMAGRIRLDPSVLEESPTEVIARRAVGEISDDKMMEYLLACAYSPDQFDPTGGDGYIRGTWREIENALAQGLLSDEEYEKVAREASAEDPPGASR